MLSPSQSVASPVIVAVAGVPPLVRLRWGKWHATVRGGRRYRRWDRRIQQRDGYSGRAAVAAAAAAAAAVGVAPLVLLRWRGRCAADRGERRRRVRDRSTQQRSGGTQQRSGGTRRAAAFVAVAVAAGVSRYRCTRSPWGATLQMRA